MGLSCIFLLSVAPDVSPISSVCWSWLVLDGKPIVCISFQLHVLLPPWYPEVCPSGSICTMEIDKGCKSGFSPRVKHLPAHYCPTQSSLLFWINISKMCYMSAFVQTDVYEKVTLPWPHFNDSYLCLLFSVSFFMFPIRGFFP